MIFSLKILSFCSLAWKFDRPKKYENPLITSLCQFSTSQYLKATWYPAHNLRWEFFCNNCFFCGSILFRVRLIFSAFRIRKILQCNCASRLKLPGMGNFCRISRWFILCSAPHSVKTPLSEAQTRPPETFSNGKWNGQLKLRNIRVSRHMQLMNEQKFVKDQL